VAKVMVSMPDELLEALDARARERGTTRRGLLQELTQREVSVQEETRRRRIRELLDEPVHHHGADSAAYVREMRDAR
jgi:metal-responsive CopG/Arc/MetJ family transcriptional regulator